MSLPVLLSQSSWHNYPIQSQLMPLVNYRSWYWNTGCLVHLISSPPHDIPLPHCMTTFRLPTLYPSFSLHDIHPIHAWKSSPSLHDISVPSLASIYPAWLPFPYLHDIPTYSISTQGGCDPPLPAWYSSTSLHSNHNPSLHDIWPPKCITA
jgi:hypothetical protein